MNEKHIDVSRTNNVSPRTLDMGWDGVSLSLSIYGAVGLIVGPLLLTVVLEQESLHLMILVFLASCASAAGLTGGLLNSITAPRRISIWAALIGFGGLTYLPTLIPTFMQ